MENEVKKKMYNTKDILLVAAYFTKLEGYHPVSSGHDSTKEKVIKYLSSHNSLDDLSEYTERSNKALNWLSGEKSSDWVDNLNSFICKKEVDDGAIGILSSLFSGYDHYQKKVEFKNSLRKSEYQGKPKDNIAIQMKNFKHITQGKTKFNKEYHLIQILDQLGNVYIWFADKDYSNDLEKCQTVYAVVKAHNERDGIKQTIIDVQELF